MLTELYRNTSKRHSRKKFVIIFFCVCITLILLFFSFTRPLRNSHRYYKVRNISVYNQEFNEYRIVSLWKQVKVMNFGIDSSGYMIEIYKDDKYCIAENSDMSEYLFMYDNKTYQFSTLMRLVLMLEVMI